jgi:hypothetical protein
MVPFSSHKRRTIELRLMRAQDMFEVSQSDLFSEYRNFLTGVDFSLSELRGSRSRRPVRLEIRLPAEEIDDGVEERLVRTLRRYCEHRMRYNRLETRAVRFGGLSALWVGLPVATLGFLLVAAATSVRPRGGAIQLLVDHLGWVLMWLGLWYPLDQFLFYPLIYGREDRALRLLAGAEVAVLPYEAAAGTTRAQLGSGG